MRVSFVIEARGWRCFNRILSRFIDDIVAQMALLVGNFFVTKLYRHPFRSFSVYIPTVFNQPDLPTLHQFIEQHSFAVLCSAGADRSPFASHLPLLLDRRAGPLGTLVGHMARANPHWHHADGKPVLAIFSGPHAYVSPSWYEATDVVPTWNYVAVHATGILRALHDRDTLLQIVRDTVTRYEASRPQPWVLGEPDDYIDRMLRGIVGFRIKLTSIEGKWKLSQNQPADRRAKVRDALRQEGTADAAAIADLMADIDE
jgi:transcriptional regulator